MIQLIEQVKIIIFILAGNVSPYSDLHQYLESMFKETF